MAKIEPIKKPEPVLATGVHFIAKGAKKSEYYVASVKGQDITIVRISDGARYPTTIKACQGMIAEVLE